MEQEGPTHYLTQERLDQLKAELNELKTKRRIDVAERLKRAKELGDLSENAEYAEARDEQRVVESRIAELEDMIRNASIIHKSAGTEGAKDDSVQIGSTVEVQKNGQNMRFTIVGSDESKPEDGLISNESPLGKAFIGKKEGEETEVNTPKGPVTYKILKIE